MIFLMILTSSRPSLPSLQEKTSQGTLSNWNTPKNVAKLMPKQTEHDSDVQRKLQEEHVTTACKSMGLYLSDGAECL